MLSLAPSPNITSFDSPTAYSPHSRPLHHEKRQKKHPVQTPLAPIPQQRKHYPSPPLANPHRRSSTARSLDSYSPPAKVRRRMVDAGTQWSPPDSQSQQPDQAATGQQQPPSQSQPQRTSSTIIEGLKIADENDDSDSSDDSSSDDESPPQGPLEPAATAPPDTRGRTARSVSQSQAKRHAEDSAARSIADSGDADDSPTKKKRPEAAAVRTVPRDYEFCDTRDLVILISSMLMELIRYNDAIPLKDGHLTRFHSRAPPGISVQDYLQRLTTHATLSPPILLSMVYYIDRLCAMYPAFTITSLTVHRFLIASSTVASKGLSDSFWTNKTYARVGGVSIKELALLELEFLTRLDWKIVPKPEVLCDYYVSLVKRSETHQLAQSGQEGRGNT
jgi:hypothetical protein